MYNILKLVEQISELILAPIFYKLLYMSLISTIVGIVLVILMNIFKNKISPKWINRMWVVFLFTLLIPLNIQTKFSIYNYFPVEIVTLNAQFEDISKVSFNEEYINTKSEYQDITKNVNNTNLEKLEVEKEYKSATLKKIIFDILVPIVYFIILAILLITYICGYFKFTLKLRKLYKNQNNDKRLDNILEKCKQNLNITRKIKLVEQDIVHIPSIFGLFNPYILIYEEFKNLSDEKIEYIFIHELAHFKRADNIFKFSSILIKYVYWFNPIITILINRLITDIELATDELVVKAKSAEYKKEYCKTLVEMSSSNKVHLKEKVLCISSAKVKLKNRINMVKLSDKFQQHKKLIALISMFIIIFMLFVFGTTRVTNNAQVLEISDLNIYADINILDKEKIKELAYKLPYSKYLENIDLNNTVKPYSLELKYNYSENTFNSEYINIIMFALIKDIEEIEYIFENDIKTSYTRDYYENILGENFNLDSVQDYIKQKAQLPDDPSYNLSLNVTSGICFKNKDLAFITLKKDYKEAINEIKITYNLSSLNSFNYHRYIEYGNKIECSDDTLQNECRYVAKILEVYSNNYKLQKIEFKYPMKNIIVKVHNLENNVQEIERIANIVFREYASTFYGSDTMEEQRIYNNAVMSSELIAGDLEEFIVKVNYHVYSKYNGVSSWGVEKYDNMIEGEVEVRVKKLDDTIIQKVGEQDYTYIQYQLIEIGKDLDTSGLKIINQSENKLPVKDYSASY